MRTPPVDGRAGEFVTIAGMAGSMGLLSSTAFSSSCSVSDGSLRMNRWDAVRFPVLKNCSSKMFRLNRIEELGALTTDCSVDV